MEETSAQDFFNTVTDGDKKSKVIQLRHKNGSVLSDVHMTVVSKKMLADTLNSMPDEVFEAAQDEDMDAEDVEEMDSTGAGNAVSGELVAVFERLCHDSLKHDGLSSTQWEMIIGEFDFQTLFDLGSDIIDLSIEQTGSVKDFQEQK